LTPPALPAPPSVLAPVGLHVLPAGAQLHRTHSRSRAPSEFNPGKGQPMRWSPFDAAGSCVSTLYAATTREAAVFESIFHDIDPQHPFKTVRRDVVQDKMVSLIATKREMEFVPLFSQNLSGLNLARTDLIDTPKSTYAQTVQWAKAFHETNPDADGLVWTSKRADSDKCVVLFGDRATADDFEVLQSLYVADHVNLLAEIVQWGRTAGITLT
jgi:hypothetical protein